MSNAGQFLVQNAGEIIQEIPIDNYDLRQGRMSMIALKVGFSVIGYK